jgi:SAM-dependent methyltransferase
MGVEKMNESNQQRQMEPIVGLARLTGHGLSGVAEPFAWLDALFVDPPRRLLRVLHADELEALLDEELIEDDAEELEVAEVRVEAQRLPEAAAVVAPAAAKAAVPVAAVARDPIANMVLDALSGRPAVAARPEEQRTFGRFWHDHLPQPSARRSGREAEFVAKICGLAPGARVLDAGCGAGRHAIEFARRGYVTTGVELSEELLEVARARAKGASALTFLHGDLRTLAFTREFDAAVLLDSTLGLHEDGETVEILRRLSASLVAGGRLVVEVLNRDFVLDEMPARKWLETAVAVILDDVSFQPETSRLRVKRSVAPHGQKAVEFAYSLRLYALHELRVLLSLAGFDVVEVAGSIHQRGAYLGSRDRSIWIHARRRSGS